ncbi:Mov34/MPN/PAD-1 family protein [Qipengyuania sp.]|uniref:Mov34/MPN/PAD-1 family protein n=1 Tax=Qipengyuania sp. TaxID=2004515 RepID=UPI0035C83F21
MTVNLTSEVHGAILALASQHHPREACGLLFGTDTAITAHLPARNVHPTPESHFEIDPQALIDAHRAMRGGGPRLIGYYHSHPRGPARPSATDRAMAAGDGMIWAIAGEGELRLWRDGKNGFAALSYTRV